MTVHTNTMVLMISVHVCVCAWAEEAGLLSWQPVATPTQTKWCTRVPTNFELVQLVVFDSFDPFDGPHGML